LLSGIALKKEENMNTKNLLYAILLGGIISTFFSNVPVINFINCLLCAGFWLGPVVAVWFYRRQTGTVTLKQSIGIGTLAGVCAGAFGFLLSFVGLAGAAALMKSYTQFLPATAASEGATDATLSMVFTIIGVGVNIVFGALGGLLAGLFYRSKA
jgi:hypothetical protein